ncbi:hypothetical protein HU200_000323 [Digitaria exilis]|uniref:Uncharacterized protein n=1 Tax=Digitaria exilis TaxID=1010633 RepID=A0A835FZA8_9POAL|nr:hypothetical protein HU200_000323 [Digitaria exilis]CAB3445865.1 unnamed protein product [Digitaria exilis]
MSSSPSPPPCSKAAATPASRYCLCAPTTHPGSFRCRLHRSPADADSSSAAADQEEAAAAAVARAFLERVARKPRRQSAPAGTLRPGPSRLGGAAAAAATAAMDD